MEEKRQHPKDLRSSFGVGIFVIAIFLQTLWRLNYLDENQRSLSFTLTLSGNTKRMLLRPQSTVCTRPKRRLVPMTETKRSVENGRNTNALPVTSNRQKFYPSSTTRRGSRQGTKGSSRGSFVQEYGVIGFDSVHWSKFPSTFTPDLVVLPTRPWGKA